MSNIIDVAQSFKEELEELMQTHNVRLLSDEVDFTIEPIHPNTLHVDKVFACGNKDLHCFRLRNKDDDPISMFSLF